MFGADSESVKTDKVVELIEQLKELGVPFTVHIRNGETIVETGGR